jgi:mannosyl-oligosaccharide alpha-1,2-mannosidase
VNQILDHIPKIDFTKANYTSSISLFETTIRYLGGLVSGMIISNIISQTSDSKY